MRGMGGFGTDMAGGGAEACPFIGDADEQQRDEALQSIEDIRQRSLERMTTADDLEMRHQEPIESPSHGESDNNRQRNSFERQHQAPHRPTAHSISLDGLRAAIRARSETHEGQATPVEDRHIRHEAPAVTPALRQGTDATNSLPKLPRPIDMSSLREALATRQPAESPVQKPYSRPILEKTADESLREDIINSKTEEFLLSLQHLNEPGKRTEAPVGTDMDTAAATPPRLQRETVINDAETTAQTSPTELQLIVPSLEQREVEPLEVADADTTTILPDMIISRFEESPVVTDGQVGLEPMSPPITSESTTQIEQPSIDAQTLDDFLSDIRTMQLPTHDVITASDAGITQTTPLHESSGSLPEDNGIVDTADVRQELSTSLSRLEAALSAIRAELGDETTEHIHQPSSNMPEGVDVNVHIDSNTTPDNEHPQAEAGLLEPIQPPEILEPSEAAIELRAAVAEVYLLVHGHSNTEQIDHIVKAILRNRQQTTKDSAETDDETYGMKLMDRGTHERLLSFMANVRNLRFVGPDLHRFIGRYAASHLRPSVYSAA